MSNAVGFRASFQYRRQRTVPPARRAVLRSCHRHRRSAALRRILVLYSIHGQSGFKVHPIGFDPTGASRIGTQRGRIPVADIFFGRSDSIRLGRANRAPFRQIGRSDSDCPDSDCPCILYSTWDGGSRKPSHSSPIQRSRRNLAGSLGLATLLGLPSTSPGSPPETAASGSGAPHSAAAGPSASTPPSGCPT